MYNVCVGVRDRVPRYTNNMYGYTYTVYRIYRKDSHTFPPQIPIDLKVGGETICPGVFLSESFLKH